MADVNPIRFDATVRTTRQGGARPLDRDEPVLVNVDAITIDTSQFCSRDKTRKREGVVTLEIGGQTTTFPYKGEGKDVSAKFLNKVVYLGENPGGLGIGLSVIESDAKTREALGDAANWTQRLARVPMVAAINPAVGPGLGLLSSVLRFIQANIEDDCEAQAFCVVDFIKHDEQLTVQFCRTPQEPPVLTVNLHVIGLGKIHQQVDRLSVRIRTPQLTLKPDVRLTHHLLANLPRSLEDWITEHKTRVFNFEATSGASAYSYTNSSGDIRPAAKRGIVAWESNEIFSVSAVDDANKTIKMLPLFLAFSLHPEKLATEGILDLLKQGTAVVSAVKPDLDKAARVLSKQAPNVLNFLSEITSESLSLYSFNGLVVLSDKPNPIATSGGRGVLVAQQIADTQWSVTIDEKITWRDTEIGQLQFTLELAAV